MAFREGDQSVEILESGIVAFRLCGLVDATSTRALFDHVRAERADAPSLVLLDVAHADVFFGVTRHVLLDSLIALAPRAIAAVTAAFLVRVPLAMVLEVVAIEAADRPPYRFFSTEPEASVWLEGFGAARARR